MTSHLRSERHSVSDLKVHLVCVTKYRRSVFTTESLDLIEETFRDVSKKMDFQLLEFNGEGDQVHVLIEYPPKLSISQIVNSLKGVSSRELCHRGVSPWSRSRQYGRGPCWISKTLRQRCFVESQLFCFLGWGSQLRSSQEIYTRSIKAVVERRGFQPKFLIISHKE
jgi:putative transposase